MLYTDPHKIFFTDINARISDEIQSRQVYAKDYLEEISTVLSNYNDFRSLKVGHEKGKLVIEGNVKSHYKRQIVQTIVQNVLKKHLVQSKILDLIKVT